MKISSVKYIGEYILDVSFVNGVTKRIDLREFLMSALNPMTTKFRDIRRFKSVRVEHGHLTWGDSEMDLSAEWLYKLKSRRKSSKSF